MEVSADPVGAVEISTAGFLWNGRGVSRTKTGNQTGDCPGFQIWDFPLIYGISYGAAVFDFRSIFSNEIKEMG